MVLVPFLDRGIEKNGKSPMFTLAGIVALVFMIGMTMWGYASLLPLWIVIGTAVLLYAVGYVTRDRGTKEDQ
jgi:quinol-cytochrome oxidoreductase complex cytochrome b subunit